MAVRLNIKQSLANSWFIYAPSPHTNILAPILSEEDNVIYGISCDVLLRFSPSYGPQAEFGLYRPKRAVAICDRVLASRFSRPVAEFSKGALRTYRYYLVIFRSCFALSFSCLLRPSFFKRHKKYSTLK